MQYRFKINELQINFNLMIILFNVYIYPILGLLSANVDATHVWYDQ